MDKKRSAVWMTHVSYSEIDVTYLANGSKLVLPVHELQGAEEGPVVGISAAVHGDEIIGTEIIRQVIERLKDERIKGTIKFLPVVNPLAFEDLSRNTTIDRTNLNRVFPGNKDGTLTEILAYKMTTEFLDTLDVYVDLHAGGAVPIVDYIYIMNDEEMSRSFGSPVLYRPKQTYTGTTASYTVEKGVPSVVVEIGGGPNYTEYIERGVNGVLNILKQKEVISGTPTPRPKQTVVSHIANIKPHHGGLCVPAFEFDKVNQVIEGKQTLAKIYNPLTLEVVEEIVTPFEQNLVILMRGLLNRVHAGDFSFMIGDLSTAEVDD
jgi:predicted deacylase